MKDNIKAGSDIHAGDGGYTEGTQEEYEKFVKVRNQSLIKARIREFEKQSGLEIYGLGARREKWEHCMEKFAELIVQECVSICKDKERPNLYGVREVEEAIKQHFGVEE